MASTITNDSCLLALLYDDSNEAFKQLFVQYYSPLCEYASRYVPGEETEELVQELMLYLWENRKILVIESSLRSYLFTATKYRCLNMLKKQQFHRRVHSDLQEKTKGRFDDPDYYLMNDLEEQLRNAINQLPENYRRTFALSRMSHYTNIQIAQLLGVSLKTVEYRITQSLKILRHKLKP
ncbi:MAG: RNA polymerase sigma-70 factor [Tannerellaceae bacterium]|jgi:RNA polymerase sigma-70 factor (ECF subfamily)|nr:RNA polymerase sigma-70 factor [Tannerellaceae bacterium]